MGFDVFEIDAKVVSGVTKAIGAEIGREQLVGFTGDVDADGDFYGVDVLPDGQATREVLSFRLKSVGGRVDA